MAKVQQGRWYGNWFVCQTLGSGWFWCECSCGLKKPVIGGNLAAKGKSRNCPGHRESDAGKHNSVRRHSLYAIWNGMMQRCYNPKRKDYKNYGGRGTKVCPPWHDIYTFAADMGKRRKGTQLDRIDPNGNYEPDNCHWATPKQNSRNRRSNRYITANGQTKLVVEWVEITGLSFQTIVQRIDKHGWSEQDAVTIPKRPHKPHKK